MPHFLILTAKISETSAILLKDISSSRADFESVVVVSVTEVAISLFPFDAPEENVVMRGKKSPMGGPERPVEDVSETETGTEVKVKDEDIHVVSGNADVGVSGYESEGFTPSKFLRRKRLSKGRKSEGVVDTSHLPQCEF